jgi:hypothetical protein
VEEFDPENLLKIVSWARGLEQHIDSVQVDCRNHIAYFPFDYWSQTDLLLLTILAFATQLCNLLDTVHIALIKSKQIQLNPIHGQIKWCGGLQLSQSETGDASQLQRNETCQ